MRRWIWYVPLTVAVCCGLGALMIWSVAATVGWWLAGELVALSLVACWLPDQDPARWSTMLARTLPWPTLALAAGGLFMSLDTVTAMLVSVATLLAAWEAGWFGVRRRAEGSGKIRRGVRRRRATAAASAAFEGPVAAVEVDPADAVLEVTDELTDADLCRAWRSSYVALDRSVEVGDKLRAVEVRELILDEFERRDGAGLKAWFRSGARAAGGPDRYLGHPPDHARG